MRHDRHLTKWEVEKQERYDKHMDLITDITKNSYEMLKVSEDPAIRNIVEYLEENKFQLDKYTLEYFFERSGMGASYDCLLENKHLAGSIAYNCFINALKFSIEAGVRGIDKEDIGQLFKGLAVALTDLFMLKMKYIEKSYVK